MSLLWSSKTLCKHGKGRRRQILHTWSRGKRVYLELQHRRWKCKSCKRTFSEGKDLIRPYSRITKVAEVEALWQLKDRSFAHVERDLGISYSTLRHLLERLIDENMLSSILKEDMFPQAQVVADAFHVIADANKRMDEARRIEQDIYQKRKVKIPKKIFLISRDKLSQREETESRQALSSVSCFTGFLLGKRED